MTDKELKKLNRKELLEMLIEQMKENEKLRSELEAKATELKERSIKLENSGNIAEAALQINKVFEAAQEAANQYIENVKSIENSSLDNDAESKETDLQEDELCEKSATECIFDKEEYEQLKQFYEKYKWLADAMEQDS